MKKLLILFSFLISLTHSYFCQTFDNKYIHFIRTGLDDDCGAAIMDVDFDNRPDVLLGFQSRKEFLTLKNNEFNLYQIEPFFDTIRGCQYIKTFDYENDGDIDILMNVKVNYNSFWNLFLLKQTSQGQYESILIATYSSAIYDIQVVDLDLDNDQDFIVDSKENGNILYKYKNLGNDSFEFSQMSVPGQPIILHGIGNFNGDNLPDAFVTYYNFTVNDYIFGVFENLDGSTFSFQPIDTINEFPDFIVGDFLGNTLTDFIMKPNTTTSMLVFENLGNYNFQTTAYTTGTYNYLIPPIDYDNDGDLDFFLWSSLSELRLFKNNNGVFQESLIGTDFYTKPFAFIDMNGDGLKDIVSQDRGNVIIHNNKGADQFVKYYDNKSNLENKKMHVYDRDNNGTQDIVVASFEELTFLDQQFTEHVKNAEKYFIQGSSITSTSQMKQMESYDKDGDGGEDLLCYIGSTLLWVSYENGTYSQEIVGENISGYSFWIGDLDFDGAHDIVVSTTGTPGLKRFEKNGSSYTVTDYNNNVNPFFDIGDIDNDGVQDIITYAWDSGLLQHHLKLCKNEGNSFSEVNLINLSPSLFSSGDLTNVNNPISIKLDDTDLDGDLDIFLMVPLANKLVLFQNDGNENFTAINLPGIYDFPSSLVFANLDGIAGNELIFSNRNDGQIVIMKNDGSNNFTQEILTNNVAYPENIKISDYNQDGDLDVVSSSIIDLKVIVLQNQLINCKKTYSYLKDTICQNDSLFFNGNYLQTNGLFFDTLINSALCDSIVGIDLFVKEAYSNEILQSKCPLDSIFFNGEYISQIGTYTAILQAQNSCDSIITLVLSNHQTQAFDLDQDNNFLSGSSTLINYSWYYNNEIIPSENSNLIDVNLYGNGEYFAVASDPNSCELTSNVLTISNATIGENNSSNMIKYYPIPADKFIFIEIETDVKLDLYSFDGKLISKEDYKAFQSNSILTLEIDKLSSGNYFVQLISPDEVFMLKIIKR
jgi:hypothetical protein